jgi:hypothetical protein
MHSFYWDECECPNDYVFCICRTSWPNFIHKPTGFAIKWYKYAFRSASTNINVSEEILKVIVDSCIKSIEKEVTS